MKRFYISAWATFESYQFSRPPAVIITVIAKTAGLAQASVKDCYAAREYQVFDCTEQPIECDAALTFEEWRDAGRLLAG